MTDARPADSISPLSTADALAESGDWAAAIDAWHRAACEQPSLVPAVERRLEWFLAETGYPLNGRARTLPLVMAFFVATALATAFLILADQPGSRSANLLAVAAWVMIVAATGAALVAARRSGEMPLGRLVESATRAARKLESKPAAGEST